MTSDYPPKSLSDEEMLIDRFLNTSISPHTSFTMDTDEADMAAVEEILGLPEDEPLDIAATIVAETDLDKLQLDQHTFDIDLRAFTEPECDIGIGASGPQIIPFPVISNDLHAQNQVLQSPKLDFYHVICHYVKNGSIVAIQSLEDRDNSEEHSSSLPPSIERLENNQGAVKRAQAVANGTRKPPRARRRRQLEQQIQAGLRHAATVVETGAVLADLPQTKGGWKGRDFRHRSEHIGLRKDWENGTIGKILLEKNFEKVPYKGCATWLVDKFGIGYALRTEQLEWLLEPFPGEEGVTYLDKLNSECYEYKRCCGDNPQTAIDHNYRGDHWASTPGVDRQSKKEPNWTKFHRDHLQATLALLKPGTATRRLIDTAASIFELRFPMLAARVRMCTEKLIAMGCDPSIATPLFGHWYNYCINAARPHASVEGVSCQPHTDGQNLAIMMCVLFVWGDFDWKEKAWLVLWEADVIVQLPIGVLFYYPSALFIHFNINITDIDQYIVTTDNDTIPTRKTARPINGVKGRGSIVFFNQASVFQYAELGRSVSEAEREGLPTAANNEPYVQTMPVFDIKKD